MRQLNFEFLLFLNYIIRFLYIIDIHALLMLEVMTNYFRENPYFS